LLPARSSLGDFGDAQRAEARTSHAPPGPNISSSPNRVLGGRASAG
jgi:hypothetical protein